MRHFIRAEARYPQLWRQCDFATEPTLGISGSVLHDNSGFNRNMTMGSGMSAATGWEVVQGKQLLTFGGVNDWLSTPDFDYNRTQLSACCWIHRTAGSATSQAAFGHYYTTVNQRAWFIGTAPTSWSIDGTPDGNELAVIVSLDGGPTNLKLYWVDQNISDDILHHVGFTFNAGVLKVYLDGVERTTKKQGDPAVTSIHAGTSSIAIGAVSTDGTAGAFWSGQVGGCRIYSRVMTDGEWALLARRPAIEYETVQRRRYKAAAAAAIRYTQLERTPRGITRGAYPGFGG